MRNRARQVSILFLPGSEFRSEAVWRPYADVYRTCEGWLVKFDLAGVRPQDISVEAQGSRLTVSGIRRDWMIEEGWSHYSMEITYSRFERSLDLPCDLAEARIAIECREGMLLVRVAAKGESE